MNVKQNKYEKKSHHIIELLKTSNKKMTLKAVREKDTL